MPVPPAVRAHHVRHRPTWSTDVRREGTTLITRRPGVLDLGAVGKGYLVDIVTAILRDAGLTDLLVDAGGDLRHAGEEAVSVGLEHPQNPKLAIGTAHLHDALATALFFTSAERLAAFFEFQYVLMAADGRAARPSDFEGELFTLSK